MGCAPTYEEMRLMEGEAAKNRLVTDFPRLVKRYFEIKEIFEKLGHPLKSSFDFETQRPVYPKLLEDYWPTKEEAILLQNYALDVSYYFLNMDRWLCQISTELILLLDQHKNLPADVGTYQKIDAQISLHKIHREEDRAEKISKIEQIIKNCVYKLEQNNYSDPIERDNDKILKTDLEEKLQKLKSYSIEELIRDRTLTE